MLFSQNGKLADEVGAWGRDYARKVNRGQGEGFERRVFRTLVHKSWVSIEGFRIGERYEPGERYNI